MPPASWNPPARLQTLHSPSAWASKGQPHVLRLPLLNTPSPPVQLGCPRTQQDPAGTSDHLGLWFSHLAFPSNNPSRAWKPSRIISAENLRVADLRVRKGLKVICRQIATLSSKSASQELCMHAGKSCGELLLHRIRLGNNSSPTPNPLSRIPFPSWVFHFGSLQKNGKAAR